MKKNIPHLKIGNKIIEGPIAIFPPGEDNSWYEKDISIFVWYFEENRQQEISLWSDSTMNKDDNFLKPLIRFVHWEKQNDLKEFKTQGKISRPDIRILLGYINNDTFDELNSKIIEFQTHLIKIKFAPQGISLSRDIPNIENSDYGLTYTIWIRNGVQAFSFHSSRLKGDFFTEKVFELKSLLLRSMEEIDKSGWKERYSTPFNSDIFDWDYSKIYGS